MLQKFTGLLLDQLAPCYCELCQRPSRRPLPLCLPCERELPLNGTACPQCALPLPGKYTLLCGQCQQQPPPFTITIAPGFYTAPVDAMIKRFKFGGDLTLLPLLAHLMADTVEQVVTEDGRPDMLVPVPLHWRRQWQRGFNQADLLARQLCRQPRLRPFSLRVNNRACRRQRATAPQHSLDHQARQQNIRNAFSCRQSLQDLHVVIVDDVMTTGATARSLALELKRAGARRIDLWCCARTPPP